MNKQIKFVAFSCLTAIMAMTSCKKEDELTGNLNEVKAPDISEKGMNPDEAILHDENATRRFDGYLYTEGNEAGTNNIHIFKQHFNGSLTALGSVASGGAGSNSALGSQGALALSKNHRWLVAVNAGDNSISTFRVQGNGMLTLMDTESSGGTMPVSVSMHHDRVYVVNFISDNINGYTIDGNGELTPIPATNEPLAGSGTEPAQISVSPNGRYLHVTQKATNTITTFELDMNGSVIATSSQPSIGMTPFGFEIAHNRFLIVSNAEGGMPNSSSVTSYSGVNSSSLSAVNGDVENMQTAACWVALTEYDRFAYVTNTGSDNISSYYVSPWGSIYLIHGNAVSSGDMPIDICVASNNYYVYNINAGTHNITGFRRAFLGDLVAVGATGGLPDFAAGLVAW